MDFKLPPHSQEAEESIIGAILLDGRSITNITEIVSHSDFYVMNNRVIYQAMLELLASNSDIDIVSVMDSLEKQNQADLFPLLADISVKSGGSANIKTYAKIVKERALLRQLIQIGNAITDNAYNNSDSDSVLENALDLLNQVQAKDDSEIPDLQEALMSSISQLEQRYNKQGITGLPIGYDNVDRRLNGLENGDLIILAGRPAMGKSTLALNIIENVIKNKKRAIFFSLEMPKERVIDKMTSSISGVEFQSIKTGELTNNDWGLLTQAYTVLKNANLIIDDKANQDIRTIAIKCKKLNAREKLDLIVIDYMQLVRHKSTKSRFDEVSEVSRMLKSLAKDIGCPVLALSQLSRDVESRGDKRPKMSDLRESGQIEQDADVIMFIYRDEVYYQDEAGNKNIAELITEKSRFGERGTDLLRSELSRSRFLNCELVGYHSHQEKKSGGFNG